MIATIVLPTTADRGPLLEYSAGSALRQSVEDVELFIIGDGVDATTRQAASALMRQDSRVRFFDYPKHPRRGETYRHELLQEEARGEIVCYLCDRDLMMSNHVAKVYESLQTCDITSTLCYRVGVNGGVTLASVGGTVGDLNDTDRRLRRLTCIAHTRAAYLSLPHGWRTTPPEQFTDIYMWDQFLQQSDIRARVIPAPTVLYFKREGHPGWPTERRHPELASWYCKLTAEGGEARIHQDSVYSILQILSDAQRRETRRQREREPRRGLRSLLGRIAGRLRRRLSGAFTRQG